MISKTRCRFRFPPIISSKARCRRFPPIISKKAYVIDYDGWLEAHPIAYSMTAELIMDWVNTCDLED